MTTVFIHDRFTVRGKTSRTRTIFTSSYLEGLFREDQRKLLETKTTGPSCSFHVGLSLFHPFPKQNLTNAPHSACKTHTCVCADIHHHLHMPYIYTGDVDRAGAAERGSSCPRSSCPEGSLGLREETLSGMSTRRGGGWGGGRPGTQ